MAKKRKIRNDTLLKTIKKLLWRGIVLFFSISILSVIALSWFPVRYTPLMFLRFVENIDDNNYRSIRKWKSLDEISDNMVRAALAAEDANFMEHFGFDWEAIKRAMDLNRRGGKKYGASTITQQTAKNVYLTPSRSWFRKGLEAYFTILIEIFWTKERIIEIYLNVIEVGSGLYGVEAAAQTYFNKPAYKLTAFEACQIASILPNPRAYKIASPTRELQKKQRKIKQSMEYVKWKGRKKETEF